MRKLYYLFSAGVMALSLTWAPLAEAQALNPQPLPPKEIKRPGSPNSLSPQPLPPGGKKVVKVRKPLKLVKPKKKIKIAKPADIRSLNPQPLPPKEAGKLKKPSSGQSN